MKHNRLLMICFIVTIKAWSLDPRTVYINNEATKSLLEKQPKTAQDQYLKAMGLDPFVSPIHNNLGITFDLLEDPDNSIKSYETGMKYSSDPRLQFAFLFNLGRAWGTKQNIDKALDYYQKALQIIPDSKEVKTNIELLMQQNKGKGKGESDQKQDDQDENNDDRTDYKPNPKDQKYEGKELSEHDVKKIFQELKRQEQRIRADYNRQSKKDQKYEKDW